MKRHESVVATPAKQIRVLLAEDNPHFRHALKILVEAEGDIQVVGQAKNGMLAVQQAKNHKPDVVVMDIAMPMLNGIQATERILKACPEIRVLMLSAHPDLEYIQQAMGFGASGYLLKQSSTEFLAKAIREVMRGHCYFSLTIPRQLREESQIVFEKNESKKKAALSYFANAP
jgi:DNA-binding NarL/FixJ family response regulator